MKKKWLIIILLLLGLAILGGFYYSYSIQIKEYNNRNFKISYDNTWKVLDDKNVLSDNYIDTPLSDLISDIMDSIEEQNKEYELISSANITDKYEAYSFLYEYDMEQALVNIYKKDSKLIIVYYEANSEYYDIVLDSVDSMLDSLEIITGEKVN